MKKGYRRIILTFMFVSIALVITGCTEIEHYIKSNKDDSDNKLHYINSYMDESESRMMYVTADNPQEMANKVFNIIINCDNEEELMAYKSKASSNVTKKRCREVLEALDGDIDNEKCVYIDVCCAEDGDEAKYTINAHYYLTVDGKEYILSFYVIIVEEYEVFRHGLHTLQIIKYEDYKPDNHKSDYVLPEEVHGREALAFNTPVTSEHHKKLFDSNRGTQYDGRELMEEILYIVEDDDIDGFMDLYAGKNVNGENMDEIKREQAERFFEIMGGENNLEAIGGIVDFYFFNKSPQYVDCDGILHPIEYVMRYLINVDGVEYKVQIVYVSSEDDTMPDDYVGIQSVIFLN